VAIATSGAFNCKFVGEPILLNIDYGNFAPPGIAYQLGSGRRRVGAGKFTTRLGISDSVFWAATALAAADLCAHRQCR
jgi:hypothetical protein